MNHPLAAGEHEDQGSDSPVPAGAPAPAPTPPMEPGGAPAAPAITVRSSRHRVRRTITWVLVVVASVLVPLSVVTVWSVYTITNTDRYVTTMAPLARSRAVTDFVGAQATDKLISGVDLQSKVADALPKKAGFLAAPITSEVHRFVGDQITALLATEWFAQLWDRANRKSQSTVVAFLEGKPNPKVEKAREVVADVTPVLDKAITELDKKGVTVFNPLKQRLSSGHLVEVPIATKEQVAKVQSTFNLATTIGYALPFIALFVILAAVAVAIDRRKALLRCALGASIGVLVLLAGLRLGRTYVIDHAQKKVPPDVTATVFDTLLRFLQHSLRIVLLVALVVALLTWFIGPSSWARGLRHAIGAGGRWVGHQVSALNTPEHRATVGRGARGFATWCLAHARGLRVAGAVVAGIVILFGGNLSPGGIVWTAAGLVIYLLLLEVVLAWARRVEQPAGFEPPSTSGDERRPSPPPPPPPPAPPPPFAEDAVTTRAADDGAGRPPDRAAADWP